MFTLDKKALQILLLIAMASIILGYILSKASSYGICGRSLFCNDLMNAGSAIFYSMQAIAAVFVVLLFVPQAVSTWKRFAMVYVPLMFLYFAMYESGGFFSIPEESVYRFLSLVYFAMSIVVIIVSVLYKKWQSTRGV